MNTIKINTSTTHNKQARRAIVATVIGNGLEWFDFTVYSFFRSLSLRYSSPPITNSLLT